MLHEHTCQPVQTNMQDTQLSFEGHFEKNAGQKMVNTIHIILYTIRADHLRNVIILASFPERG